MVDNQNEHHLSPTKKGPQRWPTQSIHKAVEARDLCAASETVCSWLEFGGDEGCISYLYILYIYIIYIYYIYIYIYLYSCTTSVVKNPVNNGINYQPQLVQDFFHQQYHSLSLSLFVSCSFAEKSKYYFRTWMMCMIFIVLQLLGWVI